MYNGLINVYKEPGFTSMDVVAVLRGILKQKKIGHTGTLDPQAEGVLMVCLGNATKLCTFLEDKDKEYVCRMLLGTTTDTEDTTGKVLSQKDASGISEEDITKVILSFVGDYAQVPPMYSALKKDGKKLYELARQGIEIEREARPIKIYDIEIIVIELSYVTFRVKCSKGTYVRSLCRDIGEKLGVGACMDHLTRTSVSFFTIDNALKLSDIERLAKEEKIEGLILETSEVFKDKKALYVLPEFAKYIDNGNPLQKEYVKSENSGIQDDENNLNEQNDSDNPWNINNQNLFRVYNTSGQFVAVYSYDESREIYMPVKMFI